MDNVKIKYIKKILGHQQFHFSIIDDYITKIEQNKLKEIDNEMLIFLKRELNNQKYLLENLGVEFSESDLLKQYSDNLYELETKLTKVTDTSFESIGAFIRDESNNFIDILKSKYGLCSFININGGDVFKFSLYNLKIITENNQHSNLSECKNSYELEFLENQIQNAEQISKPLFDYNTNGQLYLNEKNHSSFKKIIFKEFSKYGVINGLEFKTHFFKNDLKHIIYKIDFNLLPLKTQNLSQ